MGTDQSQKPVSKLTRRSFLAGVTGTALAAAVAACTPERVAIIPTAYVPGSGTLPPATGTAVAPTSVAAVGTAQPDPIYGTVTFDKIITTSVDKLYDTQYDYSKTPTDLTAANWSLQVDGMVDNPITLNYDAVKAFPMYSEMRSIECIGNPVGGQLIGNILWAGFHMEDLLAKVKVQSKATHAKFEAADGYSTSVELKWITQPNVMMAYMMNGQPLNNTHGFPLRILMPGLYGQKMPRWITHIEFIDQDYIGFWEGNGYSDLATIQTNSIIKSPNDGATVTTGDLVAIQGVALGAPRRITKVEIQINQNGWQPAQIVSGPNTLTWTQWYTTWTPNAPGSYQIAVRATDETGFVQSHSAVGPFGSDSRDGTDAIHVINVNAT